MSKKTKKKNASVERAPSLKELNASLKKQLDSALQELQKRREQTMLKVAVEPTRRERIIKSIDAIDQNISVRGARLEDIRRIQNDLIDRNRRDQIDKQLLHDEFNSLSREIIA